MGLFESFAGGGGIQLQPLSRATPKTVALFAVALLAAAPAPQAQASEQTPAVAAASGPTIGVVSMPMTHTLINTYESASPQACAARGTAVAASAIADHEDKNSPFHGETLIGTIHCVDPAGHMVGSLLMTSNYGKQEFHASGVFEGPMAALSGEALKPDTNGRDGR